MKDILHIFHLENRKEYRTDIFSYGKVNIGNRANQEWSNLRIRSLIWEFRGNLVRTRFARRIVIFKVFWKAVPKSFPKGSSQRRRIGSEIKWKAFFNGKCWHAGSQGRYDRASFQWLVGEIFFTGRGNKEWELVPVCSDDYETFTNHSQRLCNLSNLL